VLRDLVSLRIGLALALVACNRRDPHRVPQPPKIEIDIARDLTARFAAAVTVHCSFVAGMPFDCQATVADSTLPISIKRARPGWDWRIEGQVVETRPLAAHVQGMLSDLGVTQSVTCGRAIIRVRPGERIACKLSGGGAAFVDLAPDGATSYEIALDAVTAAVRGEPLTPDHEHELSRTSGALEHLAGEEIDESEPEITDGGTQPDAAVHSKVAP
jgi:hypothetical protein